MKASFIRILLASLFAVCVSSNLYADGVEETQNTNTTIDIQISGLPGTYYFQVPEFRTIVHYGNGTTTITLDGTHMVGVLDAGIPIQITVMRNSTSATKVNVFSPNYKQLQNLNVDGTKTLSFTVPYSGSNDVLISLQ